MATKPILIGLCLLVLVWLLWPESEVDRAPGILIPEEPAQIDIEDPQTFDIGAYELTPLARFSLKARVLSREDYSWDRGANLSPVDLALGWGPMSDSRVLETIDIHQSGRFYFWKTAEPPIPLREIARHSANMHMIPANDRVLETLQKTRRGDLIRLRGLLVKIRADDGWTWVSSTTREDRGAGACEVIWVEGLSIGERAYTGGL